MISTYTDTSNADTPSPTHPCLLRQSSSLTQTHTHLCAIATPLHRWAVEQAKVRIFILFILLFDFTQKCYSRRLCAKILLHSHRNDSVAHWPLLYFVFSMPFKLLVDITSCNTQLVYFIGIGNLCFHTLPPILAWN